MRLPFGKRFLALGLALLSALPLLAQKKESEDKDSLVMLLSAKSARLVEESGEHYRKVFGPARFLHNGTYLICDTALWNLDRNYIKAFGNVKILQDETVLTSDKLDYLIDEDRAEFRGTLVQLTDKEGNLLRTRHLDFNTRDSIAIFQNGGAMKDKDGQIIESIDGTYDARIKLFTFLNEVNMFTDSVFVKTTELLYDGKTSFATFLTDLDAWKDDDMLSASGGWYDRPKDLFFFERNVHGLTPTQEAWSDSLYFDRIAMTVDMFGNAQVADSTRNAVGMAGHISYQDTLSRITLTRTPLIQLISDEEEKQDTTWVGGEKLVYYTVPMCDIDSLFLSAATTRREEIMVDAVTEYRRKAAEAAAEARKKAEEEKAAAEGRLMPGKDTGSKAPGGAQGPGGAPPAEGNPPSAPGMTPPPEMSESQRPGPPGPPPGSFRDTTMRPPVDSTMIAPKDSTLLVPQDSTFVPPPADSLASLPPRDSLGSLGVMPPSDSLGMMPPSDSLDVMPPTDSLGVMPPADSLSMAPPAPVDSTRIGFLSGRRNVKIYRKDFQVLCDSLVYNDIDSLARFYIRPVIWNEPNRQFAADSISAIMRNGTVDRASLMSNAFVAIEEDSLLFDQVRGTEMMAYFDSTAALSRFDALGGASALFYLEENETLATVNTVEAKMLSSHFKDGTIDRIFYFEDIKNDAYPVVQMPKDSRYLKGFEWRGQEKPKGPEDISERKVKASQRQRYESFPHADFKQTDIYFPGYMAGVHKQIAENERKRELRRIERRRAQARADSLAAVAAADSLAMAPADSLGLDSLGVMPPADSIDFSGLDSEIRDSLGVPPPGTSARDSLQLASTDSDSLSVAPAPVPTPEELKAAEKARKQAEREQKKAERAKRKAERKARREARWAELDRRDAEKAAMKEQKRLEKIHKRNLRVQEKIRADEEREKRVFEKYKARYERRKAREDARKAKNAAKAEQQ